MLQSLSKTILALFGWKLADNVPEDNKLLIIGAPHTSNWDFPLTLLALSALGLRFSWIAKHTLFTGVFGPFFRSIGGIPVNRNVRSRFLNQMVEAYRQYDSLTLAIAPEGTRSKTSHWKAGFYHIAVKAEVRICLGFVDYSKKTVGLGPCLTPSKNIEEDFQAIRAFYQDKIGKYPQKQSTIRLREREITLFHKEFLLKSPNSPTEINS